jgi:hypothetical protein
MIVVLCPAIFKCEAVCFILITSFSSAHTLNQLLWTRKSFCHTSAHEVNKLFIYFLNNGNKCACLLNSSPAVSHVVLCDARVP